MTTRATLDSRRQEQQLEVLTSAAAAIVDRAAGAGVSIDFIGVQPLFEDIRAYPGLTSDWVLAPAQADPLVRAGHLAIPRAKLRTLGRLLDAGLSFPAVYIAHEVPAGRLTLESRQPGSSGKIDLATSARAIDRPPVPARTLAIATHLGTAAGVLLTLLTGVAPIARHTARAALASGAALGAAARDLDPIVFGAMTLDGRTEPGTPAAFFELVRFTY